MGFAAGARIPKRHEIQPGALCPKETTPRLPQKLKSLPPVRIVKITNILEPLLYVVYLQYHSHVDEEISNLLNRMLNLRTKYRF
jgi:hypothetical protein